MVVRSHVKYAGLVGFGRSAGGEANFRFQGRVGVAANARDTVGIDFARLAVQRCALACCVAQAAARHKQHAKADDCRAPVDPRCEVMVCGSHCTCASVQHCAHMCHIRFQTANWLSVAVCTPETIIQGRQTARAEPGCPNETRRT